MESINRSVPLDEKPLLQDYEGALPVHYSYLPPPGPEEEVLARRERRRRSCRKALRKLHAIVLLGAFYYLVRFVAFPAALKLFSTCHRKFAGSDYAIANFKDISNNFDEDFPSDVNVVACHEWDEHDDTDGRWHDHEELATFKLPVSSDVLFFLSRGWSAGSVKVVPADKDSDDVIVDVLTKFSRRHLLEHARVCQITHKEGENGVGIFTKRLDDHQRNPRRRRNSIAYEVIIHLPKSSSLDSPLVINSFETDMPLFAHVVEDIAGQVNFKNILLKTANTPISVQSVAAEVASFETINSPINGVFNTSSSLRLSTANSPIKAHIGMLNSKDSEEFTTLDMSTSNAAVEAFISLKSKEETGGKFKVTSQNTVSHLSIAFPTAPVDSTLILDVSTSITPATVNLHETYEGKFFLETSLTRPKFIVEDKEDPSGEGRKRVVDVRNVSNKLVGSVGWSEEGKEVGEVRVKTSISPLTVYV